MKYWYLKNGDIFGPLEPREIMADLGPYTDTLVCPEPHSANQDYWKELASYPEDFGPFLKNMPESSFSTSLTSGTEPLPTPVVEPQAPVSDHSIHTLKEEHFVNGQEPEGDPVPLSQITEQPAEAISDLEPEADEHEGTLFIPKNKSGESKPVVVGQDAGQPKEEPKVEIEKAAPISEETAAPSINEAVEPEEPLIIKSEPAEEIITVAEVKQPEPAPAAVEKPVEKVLEKPAEKPVEKKLEADIPTTGIEETFTTARTVRIVVDEMKETPQMVDKAAQTQEIKKNEADPLKQPAKDKSFFSAMKDEQPSPEEAVETTDVTEDFPFADENSMVTDEDINTDPFIEIENKLIGEEEKESKATLNRKASEESEKIFDSAAPTVNGKIISSYEAPAEAQKPRNDTIVILIAFMIFFVIVALFMTKFMDKDGEEELLAQEAAVALATEDAPKEDLPIVSPDFDNAQAAANAIPAALENRQGTLVEKANEDLKMKAQEIVKRYLLSESKGTIGEYFDRLYGNEYQKKWASSLLYGDAYVVEFVASRVRKEPIVYLFRVDLKKGVVTSGLNNITLDLLQN